MNYHSKFPLTLFLFSSLFALGLQAQEGGQGGGGESAAESSVTTSSSKKSAVIPDTVEANPVANVIRAGLPINSVREIAGSANLDIFRTVTTAGSITDLKSVATSVGKGDADFTVIAEVVTAGADSKVALNRSEGVKAIEKITENLPEAQRNALIASLKDPSKNIDKDAAAKRASAVQEIVKKYGADYETMSDAQKAKLDVLLANSVNTDIDVSKVENEAALLKNSDKTLDDLVDNEGSATDAFNEIVDEASTLSDSGETLDPSLTPEEIEAAQIAIEVAQFEAAGFNSSQISTLRSKGYTSDDISTLQTVQSFSQSLDLTIALEDNGEYFISSETTSSTPLNDTIVDLSKELLASFLTNMDEISVDDTKYSLFETLSAFRSESDVNSNLAEMGILINSILVDRTSSDLSSIKAYNANDFESKGYLDELAYFLSKYNVLGPNGGDVVNLLNSDVMEKQNSSLSGYVGALAAYTGSRTFGKDFDLSVVDIPTDNVDLYPARNFNLSGTIDLSDDNTFPNVAPAPLTNNNVNSEDIEIMVIGAAKDLTISSDLIIKNDNHVEDHALVIAAADDLYLRSEYSSANSNDYNNPENISVEYEGSNLALASQDTMVLVNVDIKTGGNLAIGTLADLHIGLSDSHDSSITIGTGGNTPSADNLYLYANELLSINGLDIRGHVRKVYMESKTIVANDIHFPAESLVLLRSELGKLNFTTATLSGHVNLKDVTHESINNGAALTANDFSGTPGHINSNLISPDGTPYIRIRGQEATAN